jgi:hypothetical protein
MVKQALGNAETASENAHIFSGKIDLGISFHFESKGLVQGL